MDFDLKQYVGPIIVIVALGLAAVVGAGWYWYSYVFPDPDRAKRVAHDMAEYDFPGEETGVMSVDLFGWFRIATTRASDGSPTISLARYPFPSDSPEELKDELFSDMRETVSAEGPPEKKHWEVCGTSTTVDYRTGTVENGVSLHVYELCIHRGEAIFCAAGLSTDADREKTRNLLQSMECS